MKRFLISTIILSAVTLQVDAQKYIAKGDRLFDQNKFEEAIPFYQKEIEQGKGKARTQAIAKLAECYRLSNQFEAAEDAYKKLLKVSKKDPMNIFNYAQALKSAAKYAEAKAEFLRYAEAVPNDPKGKLYAVSCDSAQAWLDNPSNNEVREIKFFNTTDREFSPISHKEGLVFCSSREGSKTSFIRVGEGSDEVKLDLYYTKVTGSDENLPPAVPMAQLNSPLHEGPVTFNKDGNMVFITRTVAGQKVKGEILNTLQIFTSKFDGKNWSTPAGELPFNSSQYSVGHPTLSADGRYLFFMSDMQGGQGGTDIYVTAKQKDGSWGKPINLGVEVNTFGYELFPYIHTDWTLYFASNGHPGMGKLDIFSCQFDTIKKKCTRAVNLKSPINSIWDDFGLIVDVSGKKGFFSSNRYNGTGNDDLYAFTETQPLQLALDGGKFIIQDKSLFDAIKYKLVNEETKVEESLVPGADGKYAFELQQEKKYTLQARKEGFAYNKIALSVSRKTDGQVLAVTVNAQNQPVRFNGNLKVALTQPKAPNDTSKAPPPVVEKELKNVIIKLLSNQQEQASATTDTNGFYSLGLLAARTEYKIVADKNAAAEEPKKETVQPVIDNQPPVAPTDIKTTSTAKKPIKCEGTVKSGNAVLGEVTVRLFKGDAVMGNMVTSAGGQFNFDVVMDDNYTLKASKEGYYSREEKITTAGLKEKEGAVMSVVVDLDLKVKEKVVLNGIVKSGMTMLEGTNVQLIKDGKIVREVVTPKTGAFSFQLYQDDQYNVVATKQGFFQRDVVVPTTGKTAKDVIPLDIKLEQIEVQKTIEVKNIYYDLNSTDLRIESRAELDKLLKFLEFNPAVAIELSSHTDNRGNDEDNLKLSQKRAEVVADYLASKGIARDRIMAKGYGETKPIMPTAVTEDDHQKNRRTEFKVTDLKVKVASVETKIESKKEEPATTTAPSTVASGIVFRVQVAASKAPLAKEHKSFKNIEGGVTESKEDDGMIRYYAGSFPKFDAADALLKELKAKGGDGFVVAFKDGKKIPVSEAKQLTR